MQSEEFIFNFLVRKSQRFIRGLAFNRENTAFQEQVKLFSYTSKTEGRNETNMQTPNYESLNIPLTNAIKRGTKLMLC